jgi:hypothetical protein
VEQDKDRIVAQHGSKWLELGRHGATITWKREDGNWGTLELTDTGRLLSHSGEEEMDLAAEAWARELMRELER